MTDHKLFFDQWCQVHQKVSECLKTRWEDEAFSFLDEILAEAKSQFSKPDVFLLPKTPSAKRKRTRRKKSSLLSPCHDNSSASVADSSSQEDDEDSSRSSSSTRATRSTRASARATRASKRKASKEKPVMSLVNNMLHSDTEDKDARDSTDKAVASTKSNSKKAKHSTEKQNAEVEVTDITEKTSNVDNVSDMECEDTRSADTHQTVADSDNGEESFVEVIEEWTQNVVPGGKLDPEYAITTPMKTVTECHRLSQKAAQSKTPIQNFNHMNVKEKVQAYEEIVFISPGPQACRDKSTENTPTNSVLSPGARTPDTVVVKRKSEVVAEADSRGSPRDKRRSSRNGTPRRSASSRKSFRESLRTSLHILPSKEKEMKLHLEVPNKPIKRTRLRLKKNTKAEEPEQEVDEAVSSQEEMETDSQGTDSSTEADTAYNSESSSSPKAQAEKTDSDEEMAEKEPVRAASSTRTKTRHTSKKDNQVMPESTKEIASDDLTSPTKQPVRSTRTKTRAQHTQSTVEEKNKKDSGIGGSVSSQPEDTRPRVTRSKMRKPTEDQANDNAFSSPAKPVTRVTRTKTRKRHHEDGSDDESKRLSKRSCTGSVSDDMNHTPENSPPADDESSDECMSPKCPANKVVRPHAQSFLNNLKSSNNPLKPASAISGGMVKSFIGRNSPKPTAKDIREKQKRELLEKQKKNEERLKKREDEYKKKMEEMRKKREEKMKKVQQLREQKQLEEREHREQLERRLAEKRQLTNKLREDRIREEKEKQKLRVQKQEEAEERRKQEETERKKKLHEQMKNEKSHEAFMARKKEYEEAERLKRMEEEKQRAAEHKQELEREREKERERLRQLEEERAKEWQKKKEEKDRQLAAEKAERERIEFEKKRERDLQLKAEMEKIKEQERLRQQEQEKVREQKQRQEDELRKMVDKHNSQLSAGHTTQPTLPKPNLNRTHSLTEATVQHPRTNSYEMTPDKVPKVSEDPEDYGIDDLNSGDETDDEDAPRKAIPSWAQGSHLKTLLIKQHYNPPDLDAMFDYIEVPDLNVLFEKKKARFNKRTSSAHWDTPILRPGTLGRV